ncbi:MAG: AAA family ATPase, partial [Clostridia bacterium]|nr:AAA family ATPase [Clostridia bacterium]
MAEYGLCGERLSHSYSEIIHKMLGNEKYRLLSMTKQDFYSFFEKREFCAVNVTIPYKTDAYALCDIVSDEAKMIGSVNTVVNKNGKLYGYNTDIFGFIYMLRLAGVEICGKKVLILGTGGTSLTANAACKKLGAKEAVTVSRSGRVNYENVYTDHADAQIIINTTPVGMYPSNGISPIDISKFADLSGVADVIYNPGKTRLILDAQKRGIPTAGGLSMLVAQAVEADRIFFDKENADVFGITKKVLGIIESGVRNIILVGMPGCGKTTVGKILAKKLSRELIDADEYLTKKEGRTPEDI